MTTFKHPVPTTTAHQHRIRLFQPTRRPAYLKDMKIETAWGSVKITGKLGQAHADALEAIMFCAEKKGEMADGRIKLLVDPFQVRTRARLSSNSQLVSLLDEIMAAVVHVKILSRKVDCAGHLIDHITKAMAAGGQVITRPNPLGGERALWRVELGKALTEIIVEDIWVGYDPAGISVLKHGISQALARHVLTHKTQPRGGWTLSGLIEAVAGELGEQAMRDRRREVRADAASLAEIGIRVDGDRVMRVEHIPGGVEQIPGGVEQIPGGVEQIPGAWSKYPALAGLSD